MANTKFINERFLAPSGDDLSIGTRGGVMGGSLYSGDSLRTVADRCPACGSPVQPQVGRSVCSVCGTTVPSEPYDGSTSGHLGVVNRWTTGYLNVSGPPFETNEQIRLVRCAGDRLSIVAEGCQTDHSLPSAYSALSRRLAFMGKSLKRLLPDMVNWLFNESEVGDEYVWNLSSNSRYVVSKDGTPKFVLSRNQ